MGGASASVGEVERERNPSSAGSQCIAGLLRSPFRSAEKFWVEEIIDPRKTRSLLCEFARLAEPLRTPGLATNRTIRP